MPPWLFIAFLVSLLAALGYQILRAHSLRRVPLYWVVILAGFSVAEAIVDGLNIQTPQLGELQVVPDLVGVAAGLAVLRLLNL